MLEAIYKRFTQSWDMKKIQVVMGEAFFYFHVNGSIGIVQKIDFEIRPDLGCTTPKTSRKVVFSL